MPIRRAVEKLPEKVGELRLDEHHHRHLVKVMRMNAGDPVSLFDGSGVESVGKIIKIEETHLIVSIEKLKKIEREPACKITLAFAISKGQKPDFILQKATELGVSHFFVFNSDRSIARIKKDKVESKIDRWRKIVQAACAQSGRNFQPNITFFPHTFDMLEKKNTQIKLCLNPEGDRMLNEFVAPIPSEITLMIGPEGGFSDREIEHAINHGFFSVRMTKSILRAETAAISVVVPFVLD